MVTLFLMQELYHELHTLDRFEQDYQRKRLEEAISSGNQRGNDWILIFNFLPLFFASITWYCY